MHIVPNILRKTDKRNDLKIPSGRETKNDTGAEPRRNSVKPPARPKFTIVEEEGTLFLDLGQELTALAYQHLQLESSEIQKQGNIFRGSRKDLQEILDFARLFTSAQDTLPSHSSDEENALAPVCSNLVASGELTVSKTGKASLSHELVASLSLELGSLAKENCHAAFALFSRCSIESQVAILGSLDAAPFLREIATHPEVRGSCTSLLVMATRRAIEQGNTRLLKRILEVCPDPAKDRVLRTFDLEGRADRFLELCQYDSDLPTAFSKALPNEARPLSGAESLKIRLAQFQARFPPDLDKRTALGDEDSKPDVYRELRNGGWLKKTKSDLLRLDNVPTRWRFNVASVIELMTMESPERAMGLAIDLLAGFREAVRRSDPAGWVSPHAIQAWCALDAHADKLKNDGDSMASLAKEFSGKFWRRMKASIKAVAVDEALRDSWNSKLDEYQRGVCNLLIESVTASDKMLLAHVRQEAKPKDPVDGNNQFDPSITNQLRDVFLRAAVPPSDADESWRQQLHAGATRLAGVDAGSPGAAQHAAPHVVQIAKALASAPPNYVASTYEPDLMRIIETHLSELAKANNAEALSSFCVAFAPREGGNTVGHSFLAGVLGTLVSTFWGNGPHPQPAATLLSSFLNSAPIGNEVMTKFVADSQNVLGALTCAKLLTACKSQLNTNGRWEYRLWVAAIQAKVDANDAPASVIGLEQHWNKFALKDLDPV